MCLLMYTTGGRPRKADVAKAKRAINERIDKVQFLLRAAYLGGQGRTVLI